MTFPTANLPWRSSATATRRTILSIELTHNWGTKSYEQGTAFGHLAVGVDDIYKTCATSKKKASKSCASPAR